MIARLPHPLRRLRFVMVAAVLTTLLLAVAVVSTAPSAAQLEDETFTIAVIPDTQIYVQTPEGAAIFAQQIQWVVDQRASRNIVFASHVGDVVQNPESVTEWDRAEVAMAPLDEVDLPYGIAPGNHDMEDEDGSAAEYDARFGADRYLDRSWFGGSHEAEGNRSSFQYVSTPHHELLMVHIRHLQSRYGPVEPVLAWLSDLLAAHPDHLAFVTTHEFTSPSGGVAINALQDVLESTCNVAAVFSGHRLPGVARGTLTDECGRQVPHVLTNYQGLDDGGQGFLRTVEIDPLTLTANFEVYSPTLDQVRDIDDDSFIADLAPLIPVAGDASCDRVLDINDALLIAQFSVGNRTATNTCPLGEPSNQINTTSVDIDGNGTIDIGDALIVAQCSVGIANTFCES